jgi:hypothetical protein
MSTNAPTPAPAPAATIPPELAKILAIAEVIEPIAASAVAALDPAAVGIIGALGVVSDLLGFIKQEASKL